MKHYTELIRHSGNSDLFRAVEMSIVALSNNVALHIHAEGLRGTGKTTIMRAVKDLLPPILRIKGCIYNCHPDSPHCPEHHHLSSQEVTMIGTEIVPCPFLEISHAAKIGTVVGCIDLGKLTSSTQAIAAILPGTIPQAHRGIIFIDEINRLADTSPELADILLDVMGTKPGHIQIEEVGLPSVELPASVTIWAASNPDEDPGALNLIRKQLSDRFDFGISMERPSSYSSVFNILQQGNKNMDTELDKQFYNGIGSLSSVNIGEDIRKIIAHIYVDFNLESLRSIETMDITASLSCLMAGRQTVEIADLKQIVPLVLSHRVDKVKIAEILQYLEKLEAHFLHSEDDFQSKCINELGKEPIIEQKKENRFWWKKFLNGICKIMNLINKLKSSTSYQGTGSNRDAMPGGNMQIVDPAKTDFQAPPRKAVAMRELPLEEFVNNGDHKPHG